MTRLPALERQLVATAERLDATATPAAAPSPAAPSRRRRLLAWIAGHSLLALAGTGLAAAAVATGSALVLSDAQRSAPASGTFRPRPDWASQPPLPEQRYSVEMQPGLAVGRTSWCSSVTVRRAGSTARGTGGGGCLAYVTDRDHLLGGSIQSVPGRGSLSAMIVDQTVAYALRPDGTRIVPARGRHLPNGWGVIVVLPRAGRASSTRGTDALPGLDDTLGRLRFRDAAGRPITSRRILHDPSLPVARRRGLGPAAGAAPCTIRSSDPTLRPVASAWVSGELRGRPDLNGRAMLSCATTGFRRGHAEHRVERYQVVVLVDGERPGRAAPMAFPGATERDGLARPGLGMQGGPGDILPGALQRRATSLRSGNAWIVVQGGASRARRDAVARSITVGVRP
ncbi:MAG: hypothetical protein PGN13_04630 [Patulibacter minatonensis]